MTLKQVKNFMESEAANFETATELAEAAAYEADRLDWIADETHWIWEVALDYIQC